MRVASNGRYNVIGMNKETEKVIYPFYDGFATKEEANKICKCLSDIDDKHSYIVIINK